MKRIPTIHMIHGYLGAGKTTFARKLERELPAIRFSPDEWVTRIFGHVHMDPETMGEPVADIMDRCWTRCAELGLDVVLDSGFWSRRSRDETRARAAALGAACRLYYLWVPDEVAWARVEARNRDLQGSWFIDRNAFEILKDLRRVREAGRGRAAHRRTVLIPTIGGLLTFRSQVAHPFHVLVGRNPYKSLPLTVELCDIPLHI